MCIYSTSYESITEHNDYHWIHIYIYMYVCIYIYSIIRHGVGSCFTTPATIFLHCDLFCFQKGDQQIYSHSKVSLILNTHFSSSKKGFLNMLSTWNLSPNTGQVPWGNAPTCLIPRSSSKDAVTHILMFVNAFTSQETKESKTRTPSQHEMLGSSMNVQCSEVDIISYLPINGS